MNLRTKRNISVLMTFLALACMGVCLGSAQSPSGSQADTASPAFSWSRFGLTTTTETSGAPAGGEGSQTAEAGQENSTGAHNSSAVPHMASQWTAGTDSFRRANESWGQNTSTFVPDNGAIWEPGLERFGASAQPGGIWQSNSVQSMSTQAPPSRDLSQRMNQSPIGNFQGVNQSTVGTPAPASSAAGSPNGGASPDKLLGMKADLAPENASQAMDESTNGNRFATSVPAGLSSNSWATYAAASQMRSLLRSANSLGILSQNRTRYGRTPEFRSNRASSGVSAGRTAARHGSASSLFGTGRTTSLRTPGSRSHRTSSRNSATSTTLGERDRSSRSPGLEQRHPGLTGTSGEREQTFEPRRLESNLSKRLSGNAIHPAGNSLDSH